VIGRALRELGQELQAIKEKANAGGRRFVLNPSKSGEQGAGGKSTRTVNLL
jgi:hypothetical protein